MCASNACGYATARAPSLDLIMYDTYIFPTHACLPIVIQVIRQTGVSLMSFGPGPGSKETAGRERERDREEFGP